MSFSYDAKTEVANSELPTTDNCARAELGGLLRTCAKIEDDYSITILTEIDSLYKRISGLVKLLYQQESKLHLERIERPNHAVRYSITVPSDLGKKMLLDTFILRENYAGELGITQSVSRHLIENECCEREFVKGVFMGCASANIVIKNINNLLLYNLINWILYAKAISLLCKQSKAIAFYFLNSLISFLNNSIDFFKSSSL